MHVYSIQTFGFLTPGRMSHLASNQHDDLAGERWTLEHAQQMAGHESPRTTKLYDRTKDEITLSEWSASGCDVSIPMLRFSRPRNTRLRSEPLDNDR